MDPDKRLKRLYRPHRDSLLRVYGARGVRETVNAGNAGNRTGAAERRDLGDHVQHRLAEFRISRGAPMARASSLVKPVARGTDRARGFFAL